MRKKRSLINIFVSLSTYLILLIADFWLRKIFISALSQQYLGLNGLFANILNVLSLAELGFGSAIIFALYKPFAENDQEKVAKINNYYAKIYRWVGLIVLLAGLLLIPFLNIIISNDANTSGDVGTALYFKDILIYYILFLGNSVLSYFFAHKRSLLIADQKKYATAIIDIILKLLCKAIQAVLLIVYGSFTLYLVAQIAFTLLSNIMIALYANKKYKFIPQYRRELPAPEDKQRIKSNVSALMFIKLAAVFTSGIFSILISLLMDLSTVGLYSNYAMITVTLCALLDNFFDSFTASLGNLKITESKKKQELIFNNLFYINCFLVNIATVGLIVLYNPFIAWWLGADFLFDYPIVLIIIMNFFFWNMRLTQVKVYTAFGLFNHYKFRGIAEALLSIPIAVGLYYIFGLAGILITQTIVAAAFAWWIEIKIVYKYGLESTQKHFYFKYFYNLIILLLSSSAAYFLCRFIEGAGIIFLIIKGLICVLISIAIFIVMTIKSDEFIYCKNELLLPFLKKVFRPLKKHQK